MGTILFILALAVRLLYLYESSDAPTFGVPVVDSFVYDQAARSLVQGKGFGEPFFFQPFFYPVFLAAVYRVAGFSMLAVKLIQVIIGSLTCVMAYALGKRIFGRTAGLAAGLTTAFYGPLIFYEGELLATGLAAFWAPALVLLFLKAGEKRTLFGFVLLGLSGSIAVLTRPTFLPLVLAGVIWLLVILRRSKEETGIGVAPAVLIVALGFALPALPVAFINNHVTGRFGMLPSSGGLNLYLGNNPDFERTVSARLGSQWSDVIDLPKRNGVRGDLWDRQAFYYKQVGRFAALQPASFAGGLFKKGLQFVSSRETARNVDIYLFRAWSFVLAVLLWKIGPFGFPFGLLLPLALVGLFIGYRKMPGILPLCLLVYSLSIIMVFVTARYRVPIVPLLAVLAGGGVKEIAAAVTEARRKRLVLCSGIFVAAILLATVPGPFAAERMDYEPELYCCIGDALYRNGRLDEAVEPFQRAIELKEDYADAHSGLAAVYIMQGKNLEAIREYERAIEIRPDLAQALCNLGALLTDQGRFDEAVALCRKGLEIRPHEEAFYFNLARTYAEMRDIPAMEANLKRVLDLDPLNGPALFELARQLERMRRIDEAVSHLRKALEKKPDFIEASRMLGDLLMRAGRYGEAVKSLRKVVFQFPEDVVAGHTLGVALGSSGNEKEAKEEYRRVLDMQPDFVPSLCGLAWLMSTSPDPEMRDAAKAVALAEQAASMEGEDPNVLNTLAAAYAEAGRFEEAAAQAGKAAALAERAGMLWFADEVRNRMRLYEDGKPYRASGKR